MLERFRGRLAHWLAPATKKRQHAINRRAYEAADGSRLTAGWRAPQSSADAELSLGLTAMRGRSRALVRDSGYAKRAKQVVVNNVIGSGVVMQAQVKNARGKLMEEVNTRIETAWREWCRAENCHTGGKLHFADIERLAMGQVFETGEIFIRVHHRSFSRSPIPLCLEIIEPERLADEMQFTGRTASENTLKMGIEVDPFGRPVRYWMRRSHPGDLRSAQFDTDRLESVPAVEMIHLYIVDRWPQSRGEPWLHTAMRRLNDMNGYSEAEIVAARAAASYMGVITTPEDAQIGTDDADQPAAPELELTAGLIQRLAPGEEFEGFAPNRPNANMDPFMRLMLREVASGAGVSYESLSRDYSQSNYSSSRLALIDDRDTWRHLQMWFIRSFRDVLHRQWMQAAVRADAIVGLNGFDYGANQDKYNAVAFKPRGWTWVDPTKEVEAYKEAVMAGFTTVEDVIAQTGNGLDLEDVLIARERELQMMSEKGLVFDTSPEAYLPPEPQAPPGDPPGDSEDPTERPAQAGRVVSMRPA